MDDRLGPETLIARSDEIVLTDIDDELVIAQFQLQKYHAAGLIGSDVLRLLEEPKTIGALCAALMETYDVDEATCLADVTAFLQALLDNQVVRRLS